MNVAKPRPSRIKTCDFSGLVDSARTGIIRYSFSICGVAFGVGRSVSSDFFEASTICATDRINSFISASCSNLGLVFRASLQNKVMDSKLALAKNIAAIRLIPEELN
jgi:hypothetical protein